MTWIRLHDDVLHDGKIRKLTPAQRWMWCALLVLGGGSKVRGKVYLTPRQGYTNDDLAALLLMETADEVAIGLRTMQHLGMIKRTTTGVITIINFGTRQYQKPSDRPENVRERVRRHREGVTGASVTADVTPLIQNRSEQNRTDTEQNREVTPLLEALTVFGCYEPERISKYEAMLAKMAEDFPKVNLLVELHNAAAWYEKQPEDKRWTPRGFHAGLRNWMTTATKDIDEGRKPAAGTEAEAAQDKKPPPQGKCTHDGDEWCPKRPVPEFINDCKGCEKAPAWVKGRKDEVEA